MSGAVSGVEVKLVKLKSESWNFGILNAIPTITTKRIIIRVFGVAMFWWMVRELYVLFLHYFGGNRAFAPLLNSQYHPFFVNKGSLTSKIRCGKLEMVIVMQKGEGIEMFLSSGMKSLTGSGLLLSQIVTCSVS